MCVIASPENACILFANPNEDDQISNTFVAASFFLRFNSLQTEAQPMCANGDMFRSVRTSHVMSICEMRCGVCLLFHVFIQQYRHVRNATRHMNNKSCKHI